MSEEDAQEIVERYERWDSRTRRRNFIARMEHKLYTKEHRRDRLSGR